MYNFKIYENSMTQTYNLMISFSVDSGHLGKYSYEIPHEYLQGWGNLLGKIKRNR